MTYGSRGSRSGLGDATPAQTPQEHSLSFEASENHDPSLVFEYDATSDTWACSVGMRQLYGAARDEALTTQVMLAQVVDADRIVMGDMFGRMTKKLGAFACEYRITDPEGHVRRCVMVGESEGVPGEVKRVTGFIVDISDTLREGAGEAVRASAEHRAVIEQAKGAIMVTFDVSDDAAFAVMRRTSQDHNVKLRDVAVGVLQRRSSASDDAHGRIKRWLDNPVTSV